MGYGSWQGIDVARLAKTKATRLDGSVPEIDKRKSSFGHALEYNAGGKILRAALRAVGCPPLAPKVLEPRWCHVGIAHRMLNVLMPEVGLQRASVVPFVCQREATGVA